MTEQPVLEHVCARAQLYVRLNRWPFYLSWFLSFGMIIAMSCSERLRKQYPLNYLFLVRGVAAPVAWTALPGNNELATSVCH